MKVLQYSKKFIWSPIFEKYYEGLAKKRDLFF